MLFVSIAKWARYGSSKGRGPLIGKFAPIGFKKGFGAVGLGRHTKKGTVMLLTNMPHPPTQAFS